MAKIQQTWQRWIPGLLEKAVKRGETVESGAEVTKAALEFAIALHRYTLCHSYRLRNCAYHNRASTGHDFYFGGQDLPGF